MNLSRIESLPVVQAVGVRVLKVHQAVYERSGGRVGHWFFGTHNLLLRTVGAKTGQQRTSALVYVRDGRDYVVVASMGGAPRSPGWYHNLKADPHVEIQVGTKRLPVTARTVLPGDPDRERLWELADTNNAGRYTAYQRATSRPIPVVVLAPR
jgi:deazaflavin-dependent oxidoreductase (nitroreductase family)